MSAFHPAIDTLSAWKKKHEAIDIGRSPPSRSVFAKSAAQTFPSSMADAPSTTAIAVSSGLLGLLAGYFLGQGSSIGLFDSSGHPKPKKKKKSKGESWPNSYDVNVQVDSSDEEAEKAYYGKDGRPKTQAEDDDDDEEGDNSELNPFTSSTEEAKLVLCVRTDLGMTKGKIAAQASHATLACYKYLASHPGSSNLLKTWEYGGQAKVALQVKSEDELLELQAKAMSLGLCARKIQDAGRTQIAAGSTTVLGILGPKSVVDKVTGGLKLL